MDSWMGWRKINCSSLLFLLLTPALDLNNEYLKARLRRAQCYEHVDKLEEALEGNKLGDHIPILPGMLFVYFNWC